MTALINTIALLYQAWSAIFIDVEGAARWTDALSINVANEALFDDAKRSLITLNSRIAGVSFETLADHGAHRKCVQDTAFGVHSTRLSCIAGIDAFAMEASLLCGTVAIADADGHHPLRFAAIATGNSSRWAGTLRFMMIDLAKFVSGADRCSLARISALAVDTRIVRGTLVVGATAKRCAAKSGIASMSRSTFTNRTMIDGQAFGIGTTLLPLAGGHTQLIATDMS